MTIVESTRLSSVSIGNGLELGVAQRGDRQVAEIISSILRTSLDDARNEMGGHLPGSVVDRIQAEVIHPDGVANLWGENGIRFVLARKLDLDRSQILGSALVGSDSDVIFFFTRKYNNLRHSSLEKDIDLGMADGEHKWFDRFAFPELKDFKPKGYHQLANFVIAKEHRYNGLATAFLNAIEGYRSEMLPGCAGLWQVADPPWLLRMKKLGFYVRVGAESFFIEHDWARLPPVFAADEAKISNQTYNHIFGYPRVYQNGFRLAQSSAHLMHRIPDVVDLAKREDAKLQYVQLLRDFK